MSIEWYLSEEATGKKIHREENLVFCKEQLLDKKTEIFDPTMSMANKDSAAVNVYSDLKCQEILGFGGAMTEAAALNLQRLSEANMNRILDSYFGLEEGNRYRFCRVPIGSSDFSDAPYDYVREDDLRLSSFSLKHDEETIFPEIRRAAGFAKQGLEVIATPWSPPAWMKDNGQRTGGGKLKPEFYQIWAEYYIRFIKEARALDIPVKILSIQNEPHANVSWDSCLYTAEEERDFLRDYLGPALQKNDLSDIKILIWDHNKDLIYDRVKVIMSDSEAAKYVWGVAFHWYSGDHFQALDAVHQIYPQLKLFFTEGCHGGVYRKTGQWRSGELYAHELIGDFNHWTNACIDWNMVLNEEGGPTYAGNYCDAPIICKQDGTDYQIETSYYYIGHFSRFLEPGARRILSSSFSSQIEACAFLNPGGQRVLVIMNSSDESKEICIRSNGNVAFCKSSAHSIMTLLWRSEDEI